MLSYYLKCRKNTESKHPKVVSTKNGRMMILSKCEVCQNLCRIVCRTSQLIKGQEANGLLSLEIKISLSKSHLVGPLFF